MHHSTTQQKTLICVIVCLLSAGCGGGQSQIAALPQNALGTSTGHSLTAYSGESIEPYAATCPTSGKTYTTGNGHASTQFAGPFKVSLGSPTTFRVAMTYKGWPEGKQVVLFVPQLTTCGPAWGKKPIGKLVFRNGDHDIWSRSQWSCDGSGKCTVLFGGDIRYELPSNLPNGKPWKYDLLRLLPKKAQAGYGALPSLSLEIVK
jgi:hypothetical protein